MLMHALRGTGTIAHPCRHRQPTLALLALLIAFVACIPLGACAQDLEPRAYSNAPVGLNFLVTGYAYTDGGVGFDPAVPIEGGQLETSSAIFAYARTLDAMGRSAKFDIVGAVTSIDGTALYQGERQAREIGGATDTRLRFTTNLLGAPAMEPRQFASYRQDLNIGASIQVSAPTGQYDPSRLVNIGTNRWSFKAELGMSKALGPWTLELMPAVIFYTDNTDFLRGRTLSQEPVYSVQGHVVYVFRTGMWLALDGTYFAGGRTSVDGADSSSEFDNTRLGATFALPLGRRHSLKFYGSSGTATRTGSDFNAYGMAWQYRWGAGI